ncbi:MAG TPA: decaprenyl-phosphate phosphoribosyltransferase [Streptosporangiaceae bacterium]|nr:decaprenyl-phosphate phosphoribosyltransferase [Streptosporangiaceae bacterium]
MTTRTPETGSSRSPEAPPRAAGWPLALAGLIVAAIQATRPRQWPKNLLVFAAPLAGATLGRADGFGYALVAFAAFTAASSAVYLVNDVVDAERDRLHPAKRLRPIASGRLPRPMAVAFALSLLTAALLASLAIGEPRLAGVVGAYLTMSLLYSLGLKHVPGAELLVVALGFVLRAIGGAVATHVPPSAWFLTVCSLGALMVAIGKRYTELSVLGAAATAHRPVMRWYRSWMLRAGQRAAALVMLASYVLWALSEPDAWMRGWHLASAVPLAAALFRFDLLTGLADGRPVEDLVARDAMMICCELTWLTTFTVGL